MKKILIILICLFCLKSFSQPLTNVSGAGLWTGSAYLAKLFIPTDLSNLKLWLKADGILTKDTNNYVSQWNDQSSNGYNATQGTGANQPLWVDNVLNGKPILRFDGSNDLLTLGTQLGALASYTIFVVSKNNTTENLTRYMCGNCNSAGNKIGWGGLGYNYPYVGSVYSLYGSTSGDEYDTWTNNIINTSNFYIIGSKHDNTGAANGYLYVNGTDRTYGHQYTATSSVVTPTQNFSIGRIGDYNGLYGNFDLAEIIIYSSALSDTDRAKVENYLNTKYAIY